MTTSVSINSFDRGKPFYPWIMNYLILLIGVKDLAARGGIKEVKKLFSYDSDPSMSELARASLIKIPVAPTMEDERLSELSISLSALLGPLELKSKFQCNYIKVEVDELANELFLNGPYVIQFIMHSAGSLLILAHEFSKGKPWYDRGPLWEFLRHCRNAAAHGGLFTFKGGEPRHPAEWGNYRIDRALQGTPLFDDQIGKGLLSPGDPIRLLLDIEQVYPSMSA